MEASADEPGAPATDWFGNPLRRRPDPVACPMCGEALADREAFEAHLSSAHGVRAPGGARTRARRRRGPTAPLREAQPALGRNRRSPLARRLATIPLVLVVAVNLALVLVTFAALDALGPAWWAELRSQTWGRAVVVPMLWPTILFLLVRGME